MGCGVGSPSPTPSWGWVPPCPDRPHPSFPMVPPAPSPHVHPHPAPSPHIHPPTPSLSCPSSDLPTPPEELPQPRLMVPRISGMQDVGAPSSCCVGPASPPSPPRNLPCAQVGQDSHFGGKAVRASAGARHSTSPTSPSIWEGKGSSRGRERATLSQGGRPAVPREKGSCRSWDAARRTSEGRTLGPGVAAGSGRMGSGAAAGESCIGLAADVTPQPFPPRPHRVPPPRAGGCSTCLEQHLPRAPWCPNPPGATAQAAPLAAPMLCLPHRCGVRCSSGLSMGWGPVGGWVYTEPRPRGTAPR